MPPVSISKFVWQIIYREVESTIVCTILGIVIPVLMGGNRVGYELNAMLIGARLVSFGLLPHCD